MASMSSYTQGPDTKSTIGKLDDRAQAKDFERNPEMGRQYLREMGIPKDQIDNELADLIATLKQ